MMKEAVIGRLLYVRLDLLLFDLKSVFWLLAKVAQVRDSLDSGSFLQQEVYIGFHR